MPEFYTSAFFLPKVSICVRLKGAEQPHLPLHYRISEHFHGLYIESNIKHSAQCIANLVDYASRYQVLDPQLKSTQTTCPFVLQADLLYKDQLS